MWLLDLKVGWDGKNVGLDIMHQKNAFYVYSVYLNLYMFNILIEGGQYFFTALYMPIFIQYKTKLWAMYSIGT